MANHGYVKTKKPLTPESVTALFHRLNEKFFKNGLTIEYSSCEVIDDTWGDHVWTLTYTIGEKKYAHRICWFDDNDPCLWEIRHGCGSTFDWWVDSVITNEVALAFDGLISDDGVEEMWRGKEDKYSDFMSYLKKMYPYPPSSGEKDFTPPKFEKDFTPPEHWKWD